MSPVSRSRRRTGALRRYRRGARRSTSNCCSPSEIAQELHEYAYSIRHLPHWRYVADDALPRLLARRYPGVFRGSLGARKHSAPRDGSPL